jgi:hypothetical protein
MEDLTTNEIFGTEADENIRGTDGNDNIIGGGGRANTVRLSQGVGKLAIVALICLPSLCN